MTKLRNLFVVLAGFVLASISYAQTSQLTVSWNWTQPTSGGGVAVGFEVERAPAAPSTAFAKIATVLVSGTTTTYTYSDATLTAGTSYQYRIRAYNDGGPGPYSNIASGTTLTSAPTIAPSAPSITVPPKYVPLAYGSKVLLYNGSLAGYNANSSKINFYSGDSIQAVAANSTLVYAQ